MNFTRLQIADACRAYGSQIVGLPDGVDGAQLLWGISGNESSFGTNCTPRHEPAYDVGGRYADAALLARFGRAAACSYGPWQVMFANCPPNYIPEDMDDLDKATIATVLFLGKQLNRFRPLNIQEIGAIWNSGNPKTLTYNHSVQEYAKKLLNNYSMAIPDN